MATFGAQRHRSKMPYLSPRGPIFCPPQTDVEKCCVFPNLIQSEWNDKEFHTLNWLKQDCYGGEAQLEVSCTSRESKSTVIGFWIDFYPWAEVSKISDILALAEAQPYAWAI